MVRFFDRKNELEILNEEWGKNRASFMVLYGRRRVGKTRLLVEFIKNKDGIYFIAEDTSKYIQLRDFKNALAEYFNDSFLRDTEIKEWGGLFEYLKKSIKKDERFFLIIDEFSYIIKNDPSVISSLQKFWDLFLSQTKVFFLVSGSIFGLMEDKILSSASPLYGRRSRDILLYPLSLKHSQEFLNCSSEDKFRIYMCIGGVPEYLLKASQYKSFENFVLAEFFKRNGYFYREPYFLLSQEFKEIKMYFSILNAISFGNTKPTEIANFVGIRSREIYPYLENLIRHEFILRETPVLGKRKHGIYLIKDVVFDSWFNFVYVNRNQIEKGLYKPEVGIFNAYFGRRFELLLRNEIFHYLFPKGFTKIGRWWHKDKEIDLVALNEPKKEILFGECKWQENVNAKKVLKELKEKAEKVQWHNKERKEQFAVFAKSFKTKIKEFEGKKVYCFDLRDLERFVME